jgi:hypothetical protein
MNALFHVKQGDGIPVSRFTWNGQLTVISVSEPQHREGEVLEIGG